MTPSMMRLPIFLILSLLFTACSDGPDRPANDAAATQAETQAETPPTRLDADTFLERLDEDAVVVDVRTPAEYDQGHLEGARLINLHDADFREQVRQLDPEPTYYLYCRTGNRSGQALRVFREMGYDAYNVGGFKQLANAGADVAR